MIEIEEKHPDIRIAEALECIAECLLKIANPLFYVKVESSEALIKIKDTTVVKN